VSVSTLRETSRSTEGRPTIVSPRNDARLVTRDVIRHRIREPAPPRGRGDRLDTSVTAARGAGQRATRRGELVTCEESTSTARAVAPSKLSHPIVYDQSRAEDGSAIRADRRTSTRGVMKCRADAVDREGRSAGRAAKKDRPIEGVAIRGRSLTALNDGPMAPLLRVCAAALEAKLDQLARGEPCALLPVQACSLVEERRHHRHSWVADGVGKRLMGAAGAAPLSAQSRQTCALSFAHGIGFRLPCRVHRALCPAVGYARLNRAT